MWSTRPGFCSSTSESVIVHVATSQCTYKHFHALIEIIALNKRVCHAHPVRLFTNKMRTIVACTTTDVHILPDLHVVSWPIVKVPDLCWKAITSAQNKIQYHVHTAALYRIRTVIKIRDPLFHSRSACRHGPVKAHSSSAAQRLVPPWRKQGKFLMIRCQVPAVARVFWVCSVRRSTPSIRLVPAG